MAARDIKRGILVMAVTASAMLIGACGDETSPLDGSECTLMSCNFTTIKCQGFFDKDQGTPKDLKVIYLNTDDTGTTYTAVITIDVRNISPVTGATFKGQDMLDRVTLYRPPPGEPWPVFTGNSCHISNGGDKLGGKYQGKCGFFFDNGRTLTARWSCKLEEPKQE
ncbi:MAG: hypothetical protein GXP49_12180 [Deltaproteobacteria bacterium]|nr:hypothetical protein [Deltaproteobacteria bacterium]